MTTDDANTTSNNNNNTVQRRAAATTTMNELLTIILFLFFFRRVFRNGGVYCVCVFIKMKRIRKYMCVYSTASTRYGGGDHKKIHFASERS